MAFPKKIIKNQTFLTEWKQSILQKKQENEKKKKNNIGAHGDFSTE